MKILINKAKSSSLNNEASAVGTNTKKFWEFANKKIFGKKININKNINELLVNGKSVKSDKIIANEINNFFSNVGKNLNNKKKEKG